MSLVLNIKERDLTKKFPKPNKVESQTELLKGVFYGKKEQATPIAISYIEFKKVWREAGSSSLVVLKGVGEDKEAVVQDVDLDPITGSVRHVDFYVIERGKVMEADVVLDFFGEAPAVKELGGTLVKTLHELTIEVLPKDLPKDIKVDISALKDFESRILVKDLKLSGSAKSLVDGDEVVALVVESEQEEEAAIIPDIANVEVEKKGKKEDKEEEKK